MVYVALCCLLQVHLPLLICQKMEVAHQSVSIQCSFFVILVNSVNFDITITTAMMFIVYI